METNCPVHNVPFKLVPAGVSKKTGRPYGAFYACPERGCQQKPDANFKPASTVKEEKIEKMFNEKKENIRLLNAKNCAAQIVSHLEVIKGASDDDIEREIQHFTDFFYKLDVDQEIKDIPF